MSNKEFEPFNNDIVHKEIDLIQSIITKMSSKSDQIKGLILTILGFASFFFKDKHCVIGYVSFCGIAIVSCGYFDYRYLKLERLYRLWFEFIVNSRNSTKQWLYELNPKKITTILQDRDIVHDSENVNITTRQSFSLGFYFTLIILTSIMAIAA
jgi:hypothetical protein